MFARDCAAINAGCAASKEAVIGAGLLTLLSIRQPFYLVPMQFASVQRMGADSQYLFGWKRQGFLTLCAEAEAIRLEANRYRKEPSADALDSLVQRLMVIPGLGIVKASFFAQLLVGEGACLDSHNLERLGLHVAFFKTPKSLKAATIAEKIKTYRLTWSARGSSAFWWDSWCDLIAAKYPKHFENGGAVSALHCLALQWRGVERRAVG